MVAVLNRERELLGQDFSPRRRVGRVRSVDEVGSADRACVNAILETKTAMLELQSRRDGVPRERELRELGNHLQTLMELLQKLRPELAQLRAQRRTADKERVRGQGKVRTPDGGRDR